MSREDDIERLYTLLDQLEEQVGGKQRLDDCTGYMDWPDRGVYFFFTKDAERLSRVGTHAVSEGSGTKLWDRLRTHRGANSGTYEGGGNHRGSVFRKEVGRSLINKHGLHDDYPDWGDGSTAKRELRLSELDMEQRVSEYIRDLPFLWLNVDDEPSADSDRAYLERNTIALLSNYQKQSLDPQPTEWLGTHSRSQEIQESGLWNVNHVEESYDPAFLDLFEEQVRETHSL